MAGCDSGGVCGDRGIPLGWVPLPREWVEDQRAKAKTLLAGKSFVGTNFEAVREVWKRLEKREFRELSRGSGERGGSMLAAASFAGTDCICLHFEVGVISHMFACYQSSRVSTAAQRDELQLPKSRSDHIFMFGGRWEHR